MFSICMRGVIIRARGKYSGIVFLVILTGVPLKNANVPLLQILE